MAASMNTKDLENASTAETTPLDNAVNIPLAKILKPMNNSAMVQILFPLTAKSYTGSSGRAKTDTNGSVSLRETVTVIMETAPITFRLTATSYVSFSLFCSPW